MPRFCTSLGFGLIAIFVCLSSADVQSEKPDTAGKPAETRSQRGAERCEHRQAKS